MNQLSKHSENIQSILSRINEVLLGKPLEVELALSCVIAGGHLLIEDVPGVGKTTLARTLATTFKAKFTRVQFTSDLLPSDLIGVTIYKKEKETFSFQAGPIFTHVLLADEINRANPKTQSSLLEAMHENQVSHDGKTFKLPDPFFVIATQNSQDHHGTFPLPEAQLDRFLMRLSLGYPGKDYEKNVIRNQFQNSAKTFQPLSLDFLKTLRQERKTVYVSDSIVEYIYEVVQRTRSHDRIRIGVSPRGAQALFAAAQALALVRGRDYCTPDDIIELAPRVFPHRIMLRRSTQMTHDRPYALDLVQDILNQIPAPRE